MMYYTYMNNAYVINRNILLFTDFIDRTQCWNSSGIVIGKYGAGFNFRF